MHQAYLQLLKSCLTGEIYDESAWEIVGARTKNALKRTIYKQLAKRSLHLVRTKPFCKQIREGGQDWPLCGYTMIGRKRLDNIEYCLNDVLRNNVPGDFVETGVWRGGAVIFMRALLMVHHVQNRKVWAADSFEGMPVPDVDTFRDKAGWDYSHMDHLRVTLAQVKANFDKFGLLDEQVVFLKGWFKDTLHKAPINQIAVLRLDGDLYESTIQALQPLYVKIPPGGYVIVDDYHSWPACKHAVDDFRQTNGIKDIIENIDEHAVFWKKQRPFE